MTDHSHIIQIGKNRFRSSACFLIACWACLFPLPFPTSRSCGQDQNQTVECHRAANRLRLARTLSHNSIDCRIGLDFRPFDFLKSDPYIVIVIDRKVRRDELTRSFLYDIVSSAAFIDSGDTKMKIHKRSYMMVVHDLLSEESDFRLGRIGEEKKLTIHGKELRDSSKVLFITGNRTMNIGWVDCRIRNSLSSNCVNKRIDKENALPTQWG